MTNLITYNLTGSGIQVASGAEAVSTLEKIISTTIGILTVIAVIYFVIQIILAGISMMSSQGDPKELSVAKKRLTNNIIGLALVIIAFGFGALLANIMGLGDIFSLSTILSPIQ